jgi:hypothetical protein
VVLDDLFSRETIDGLRGAFEAFRDGAPDAHEFQYPVQVASGRIRSRRLLPPVQMHVPSMGSIVCVFDAEY